MWPCNHSSTGRVVLRRSRAVLGWRRCQLYSGEAGAMQSFELNSDRRNVQFENAVRLQILQLGHCMKGAWTSDQACHNWPMCICRKAVHLVACAGAQKHLIRMCQGGATITKEGLYCTTRPLCTRLQATACMLAYQDTTAGRFALSRKRDCSNWHKPKRAEGNNQIRPRVCSQNGMRLWLS